MNRCDSCAALWTDEELHEVEKLSMRVEPGGMMPSGQCPLAACGSLCFPSTETVPLSNTVYVTLGLLEDAGVTSALVTRRRAKADLQFEEMLRQNTAVEEAAQEDLMVAMPGAVRMAGDTMWTAVILELDLEEVAECE